MMEHLFIYYYQEYRIFIVVLPDLFPWLFLV